MINTFVKQNNNKLKTLHNEDTFRNEYSKGIAEEYRANVWRKDRQHCRASCYFIFSSVWSACSTYRIFNFG